MEERDNYPLKWGKGLLEDKPSVVSEEIEEEIEEEESQELFNDPEIEHIKIAIATTHFLGTYTIFQKLLKTNSKIPAHLFGIEHNTLKFGISHPTYFSINVSVQGN